MTSPRTKGSNPYGQYQSGGGYGRQPTEPAWNGPRNGSGAPVIKGVTPTDAARIMQNWRDPGSADRIQQQQQTQAAANKLMAQTQFAQQYEAYKRRMGAGAQPPAPTPPTPDQQQRDQLIKGGIQPYDADQEIARQNAAKQKAAIPASGGPPSPQAPAQPGAPGAAKPVAPVGAPQAPAPAGVPATPAQREPSTVTTPSGDNAPMSDWLQSQKARQMNPNSIGPQGSDATNLQSAQDHVNQINAVNSGQANLPQAAPTPAGAPAKAAAPTATPAGNVAPAATALTPQQVNDMSQKYAHIKEQMAANTGRDVGTPPAPDASATGRQPGTPVPDPSAAPAANATADADPVPASTDTDAIPKAAGGAVYGIGNPNGAPIRSFVARAKGGPVGKGTPAPGNGNALGGTTWEPSPPRQQPQQAPKQQPRTVQQPQDDSAKEQAAKDAAARYNPISDYMSSDGGGRVTPEAMKKGGSVLSQMARQAPPSYKVGEKGPELLMPDDDASPPQIIGQNGPEVGNFTGNGTVVPNSALEQMRQKFAKGKTQQGQSAGAMSGQRAFSAARTALAPAA